MPTTLLAVLILAAGLAAFLVGLALAFGPVTLAVAGALLVAAALLMPLDGPRRPR